MNQASAWHQREQRPPARHPVQTSRTWHHPDRWSEHDEDTIRAAETTLVGQGRGPAFHMAATSWLRGSPAEPAEAGRLIPPVPISAGAPLDPHTAGAPQSRQPPSSSLVQCRRNNLRTSISTVPLRSSGLHHRRQRAAAEHPGGMSCCIRPGRTKLGSRCLPPPGSRSAAVQVDRQVIVIDQSPIAARPAPIPPPTPVPSIRSGRCLRHRGGATGPAAYRWGISFNVKEGTLRGLRGQGVDVIEIETSCPMCMCSCEWSARGPYNAKPSGDYKGHTSLSAADDGGAGCRWCSVHSQAADSACAPWLDVGWANIKWSNRPPTSRGGGSRAVGHGAVKNGPRQTALPDRRPHRPQLLRRHKLMDVMQRRGQAISIVGDRVHTRCNRALTADRPRPRRGQTRVARSWRPATPEQVRAPQQPQPAVLKRGAGPNTPPLAGANGLEPGVSCSH